MGCNYSSPPMTPASDTQIRICLPSKCQTDLVYTMSHSSANIEKNKFCSHILTINKREIGQLKTHSLTFLLLEIVFEYWIQHVTFGLLYVIFKFFIGLFYRVVAGFASACSCSVWWRGLSTCLLHAGPLFRKPVWNDSGFVCLTWWRTFFSLFW